MKDSYKKTAEKRLSNTSKGRDKITAEGLSREAHLRGLFAARERTEFFDEAFGDVLVDLFMTWLSSDPHEIKTREYLYSTAMALGSVKEKLISIETRGRNEEYFNTEDKN